VKKGGKTASKIEVEKEFPKCLWVTPISGLWGTQNKLEWPS